MADDDLYRLNLEAGDTNPSEDDAPPTTESSRALAVDEGAREEGLRAELRGVQQINALTEGIVTSLEKAKENMETVSTALDNANKLLNLWVRILSQTEHTQHVLFSEHWEGATAEHASLEAEAMAKQQAAERRAREIRERAAAKEREAAAAEARRLEAGKRPTRGGRRGTPATGAGRGAPGSRLDSSNGLSTRGSAASRTTRGGVGRGGYGSVYRRGQGAAK